MKNYVISGAIALVISLGVVWLVPELSENNTIKIEHISSTPVQGAVYTVDDQNEIVPLDFTTVADKVMDAVVHIKATQQSYISSNNHQNQRLPDPFRDFFGRDEFFDQFFSPRYKYDNRNQKPQLKVGTGSGVIINEEGYIVTNNHVIANAEDIEVTLYNNESYKAKVIGTDPSTDLALIQINQNNLPSIPLVDSDEIKIGEWVVAVGNPFNLNSTVTAGIVSAKSRNINILRDQYAVESFIQTDAAINPGNSGGALVNLQGGLVGINTAIASPTGSYAGYGFAVPSNIVNKVVEDLLKYGVVQRGYLGVSIRGVDSNLAQEKELSVNKGVYIDSVMLEGAADKAGLKSGDVVLKVDGNSVNSSPELQELIARHRPGDKVNLLISRNNKEMDIDVVLKNKDGDEKYLANYKEEIFNVLGAEFDNLETSIAKKLDIEGGVIVKKLYPGSLRKQTEIQEGFIITKVDKRLIKNKKDLLNALKNKNGGILIEGVYEDRPGSYFYAFGLPS